MSGTGLIAALLGALALLALLVVSRWLIARAPLSKAQRSSLTRIRPALEAGIGALYLLVAIPLVFEGEPAYTPLLLGLGLMALMWFALRDFAAGVFLRAGELCEVGDHVDIDGRAGVVRSLGHRVLVLADERGAEVIVPYSQISTRALVRTRRSEGVHPHTFELELAPGSDPLSALTRIKQLAMSSHWSSVVREPELDPLTSTRVSVRVFALGREHGPAIEAHIRKHYD